MERNTTNHPDDQRQQYSIAPPFPVLTPEEIRTLRECNRQAFYNRSLPLSGLAMLATGYAVKTGYLSKNLAWAKILATGVMGYVIGKFSYMGKCKSMILQLPNSPLAEKMRQYNNPGSYQEMMKEIAVFPKFNESKPQSIPANKGNLEGYSSKSNFDAFESYKGLDDSLRPSLDNNRFQQPKLSPKPTTLSENARKPDYSSYDDLRTKNRSAYNSNDTPQLTDPRNQDNLRSPSYNN
ncbi:unnamed protein product [Gordionus sp. m RMFG-2023]|uniref:OCIA domain-containing protein 1-like n=1 Tax=Gordionus sp. m RMFG-2023 TaxID=3053472 RepID=UPI0030E52D5D